MSLGNSSLLTSEEHSTGVLVTGYVGLLLSCISYGIMFTPLKRTNTRDGFFVQWIECSVILVTGFIVNIIRGFPPFQWIAAIGGVLYASGNVFAVPVVNALGMSIAFLIWGTIQIIVGWSVSRFGLPGLLAATDVKHNVLNYIGVLITLISGVLFIFVDVNRREHEVHEMKRDSNSSVTKKERKQYLKKLPYVFMTILLATFNGLMMAPIEILQQRHPSGDLYQVLDYTWSFFSAAFVTSTVLFFLYCLIRREKAYVTSDVVIPAVGYGILWSTGMITWLLSSDVLLEVIEYPIVTRLPAIISALLDVIVYKAITGRNNLIFLTSAVCVGTIGVVLIALSNQSL